MVRVSKTTRRARPKSCTKIRGSVVCDTSNSPSRNRQTRPDSDFWCTNNPEGKRWDGQTSGPWETNTND